MTRFLAGLAAVGAILAAGAAEAKDQLPPNISTRAFGGGKNQVIDAIDYSFAIESPLEFSRVKMCIATNVTNNAVELRDSAGSFVGATGTYHKSQNNSTVQGSSVFKYVDDEAKSAVVQGSIQRQGGLGGIIQLSIRFDLEITVQKTSVKMRMLHIEEAMRDTGSGHNNGFQPVGVWTGSMYKKDIVAMDGVAAALKTCMVA